MGKIAYGRRRIEKKIGTRNEMHVVEQDDFPVYDGQHEAIVSEEDWNLAQSKRKRTGKRREKVGKTGNVSILSAIIKCPCCGKSMYSNTSKPHAKDNKYRQYYYCKSTRSETGHPCTFRTNIEQSQIDDYVSGVISAMVHDPQFEAAIKDKIGTVIDTTEMQKELETLRVQLRQTISIKSRLEQQMDTLSYDDPYYDRKMQDFQRRYDDQYAIMGDIEARMEELNDQIQSIRQEQISSENVYQLLSVFDQLYADLEPTEKRDLMRAIIERIDLYPEQREDGCWVRNIVFNFPVPVSGVLLKELPLENATMLETVCLLSQRKPDTTIDVNLDISELEVSSAETKATYNEIKDFVLKEYGLKVTNLYIAQVKSECGIIERENYNLPKSEGGRVPQCPEDKRKAIKEAFVHFNMI